MNRYMPLDDPSPGRITGDLIAEILRANDPTGIQLPRVLGLIDGQPTFVMVSEDHTTESLSLTPEFDPSETQGINLAAQMLMVMGCDQAFVQFTPDLLAEAPLLLPEIAHDEAEESRLNPIGTAYAAMVGFGWYTILRPSMRDTHGMSISDLDLDSVRPQHRPLLEHLFTRPTAEWACPPGLLTLGWEFALPPLAMLDEDELP